LFPALRDLRITGNPVLSLSKSGGRFEVIGRVAGVQLLNGADVRAMERRDAELRYLQVTWEGGCVQIVETEGEGRGEAKGKRSYCCPPG
jgi:hypothetical protein